jgi:hypothetical protein
LERQRIKKLVPGFKDSFARFSKDESIDTAVIFVHGFDGDPESTWEQFPELIDEYSPQYTWWPRTDLFFFAYDSTSVPIAINTLKLTAFIRAALSSAPLRVTNPSEIVPKSGVPLNSFSWGRADYQNLLLVGHSEGGVLIRRLILDRIAELKQEAADTLHDGMTEEQYFAKESKTDLVLNAHLRLFAPACLGTNFSSALGFATTASSLVAGAAASFLVRNELSHTSPILIQIRSETERAFEKLPGVRGLAARVLFGDRDQIVFTGAYNCDSISYEAGHSHKSVCKPTYVYRRPLEFVQI